MKLPNLKLFVAAFFTLGVMTFVSAQETVKTQRNSLLEAALKRAEASESKSLFYIDKVESNVEAVENVPSENIKLVKVLIDDDVKKKFKEKGITQVVMITTKK